MGEENFHEAGAGFTGIIKNNEKLNKKRVFFSLQ